MTAELKFEQLADREPFAKFAIYGDSGTGKTVFASSAPRPILWVEAEGGTASIADKDDITVVRPRTYEQYMQVVQHVRDNPGKYKTLVVDSFSETAVRLMGEIMENIVKAGAKNKKTGELRTEFQAQLEDWGDLTAIMRKLVRAIVDLPVHVVVTAHARTSDDELTGKERIGPAFTPALASELPSFVDVMGYLYTATKKGGEVDADGVATEEGEPVFVRNLLMKPTGKYAARVRGPKGDTEIPDHLNNPTFDDLVSAINL